MTVPSNVGAWFGSGTSVPVLEIPLVEVRLDGRTEPRVRLERLEIAVSAAPRALLVAGFGRSIEDETDLRLEHLAKTVRPGMRISATLIRGGEAPGPLGCNLVLFEGRVSRIAMELNPDGESLRLEAEDLVAEMLRRPVGGQRVWTDDGGECIEGIPLVFNPDGRANAGDFHEDGNGDSYRLFAPVSSEDAEAWTLGEAVAYLLAEHAASTAVEVPQPSAARVILGSLVLRDVSLEGQTLGEALDALLEQVGGRAWIMAEPGEEGVRRCLEILAPGCGGSAWLAHQPTGGFYLPAETNFSGLLAEVRMDLAPRRYVAQGDTKLFESTFDLVLGWDDALATGDPDLYSPSLNSNFAAVSDVYRKWVLNEAGDYSVEPYNRGAAPDLSTLFGSAYSRRRRRLLECISRDTAGRSHGVCVEVSLDGGSTWSGPTPAVRVLKNECGIYFTEDPLPPAYLVAAMHGEAKVCVTATIESDSRLRAERRAEGADDLPGETRQVMAPTGFHFRRIAPTSRFYGAAGDVDDTDRLQALVYAAFEADRRCPAPVRVEIPGLAMGYRIGQRILGIRGRRLDLAQRGEGFESAPRILGITYDFAPVPRTLLLLE